MAFKTGDNVKLKQGFSIMYNKLPENSLLVVLESMETADGERISFAGSTSSVFYYPAEHFTFNEKAPVKMNNPEIAEEFLKSFYLVWNKAGHAPSKSHITRQSADKEARRLALMTPGQKFFVLEVVGAAQLQIAKEVSYDSYSSERKDAAPAAKKSKNHYSYDIIDTGASAKGPDMDYGIFEILIKNPEGVGLIYIEGKGAAAFLEDLKEIEKFVDTDKANGTLEEMQDVYLSQYDFDKKAHERKK